MVQGFLYEGQEDGMSGDSSVDWTTCSEDECKGIRLHTGGKCLAHADRQDLDAELKQLAEEGTIDARGVTISAELLNRILGAAPHDEQQPHRPRLNQVAFDGVTFGDGAGFEHVTFGDGAWFTGVTFGDGAWFADVTFGDGAWFNRVTFGDLALFS